MDDLIIILTTMPDDDRAGGLARTLVEERLAACVNVLPGVHSVYRWEGQVEAADEVLLLAKTTTDRYPALQARLQALHPHELPEILAVEPRFGLPDYLQWVVDETRKD